MDEQAAMRQLSTQEDQIRKLTQTVQNYGIAIDNYKAFVASIPDTFPDGAEVVSAYEWLKWAKKELGYEQDSSESSDFSS